MTHRILITDPLGEAGLSVLEQAADVEVEMRTGLLDEALSDAIGDYDALIVRSGTTVTADLIARAERLRVIGRAGVGVDNVDVDAATRHGVVVTNTPDGNTTAAVEQTIALMLAAARNTAQAHESVASGEWQRGRFTGVEMRGKTLGIIGVGRIGRRVSVIARALGMSVIAYDPYVSETVARDHEIVLKELNEVLGGCDVLTLHLGAVTERPLIDATAIASMRRGAILVNAARGSLVDAAAVAEALDSGHLAAAGIDVFDPEPPPDGHPLVGHPRVVHTPHLGASTSEAQANVSMTIAEQVLTILRGEGYPNSVNIALDGDPASQTLLFLTERIGRIQHAMAESRIERVEIDYSGDPAFISTAATGVLKGILDGQIGEPVNYVSAPVLAADHGITVASAAGLATGDYSNMVSCRVQMATGERIVSGVVFGGSEPRIVRISRFHLDARPEGTVLLLLNDDVPGVVGKVGELLGRHRINIAEWRLGREKEGGVAISFINLDSIPAGDVLDELAGLPEVVKATVVEL